MKRVGIIVTTSANTMDGFKSGLRDRGWVEGECFSFELRAAQGQLHLLPEFAVAEQGPGHPSSPKWSTSVST